MKQISIGILAHVDAGKTTLSEGILYLTGGLRKLGRVDHGDAFLDNFALEKDRGITIFSKQALFTLGDTEVTLLDTPGHVDFSAEMERCLWVMDYAVLVVSGADGIQGHTETLWRLLKAYGIPTFIFINKMDQEGTNREELLKGLKKDLDDGCIPFDGTFDAETYREELAMCDETVLEAYMETGKIAEKEIVRLVRERKVFPCYFGSALKLTGVEQFLKGLEQYTIMPDYPKEFAAKVFKITRDEQGNRLTHLKVTGGRLRVKTSLGEGEKIDQIRIYSGAKYQMKDEVGPGTVCAVTGLSDTEAGQGVGTEESLPSFILEPVMSCRLIFPDGTDMTKALRELKQLEEEDPKLHIVWNSQLSEVQMQLMGEVQTEVLKRIIAERFHMQVEFGPGHIMYKETIRNTVTGVGHYEPLRHYAEVHLKMEPGDPGSGLVFDSICSEDVLDKNWQRLILTHLAEKEHLGVLAGCPITDMKITLTAGRAHQKHTEGGDFRQATYRAVRQGLMQAQSVLLEPWYAFRLELPADQVGRAMADVQAMAGSFEVPQMEGDRAVLCGSAPVSEMMDYPAQVQSYTGGSGRIRLRMDGYRPCHNEEDVLSTMNYDCEGDVDNPSGSVFCSHGVGYYVPWDQVAEHMHIKEDTRKGIHQSDLTTGTFSGGSDVSSVAGSISHGSDASAFAEDKELEEIFIREVGSKKQQEDRYSSYRKPAAVPAREEAPDISFRRKDNEKQYLLVDGYNIIFAWDTLKELPEVNLEAARNELMDILCNYQGFTGYTVIVVFDAYKVKGNPGEIFRYHNIHVVYTKEAETADQYIEKTTHELGRKYQVTVATSDSLEQVIVMGQGARRIAASDFLEEVCRAEKEIRRINEIRRQKGRNYLFDHMDKDMAQRMEDIRLGKAEFPDS
ncbi:MAG: TetM/TetW/TetO/TetS family tetracycline resistance ribosomal protection protein [Clostridiales bacterium]|nr:TetM/TetW/TetO/TetS family tetracycline resistance ribosomal protection protein [Clostridiales bacterium]